MYRNLKNTLAVLLVTAFTALAIFGTVQLTGHLVGTTSIAVATPIVTSATSADGYSDSTSSSGLLVCPATGCSAQSCHAAH